MENRKLTSEEILRQQLELLLEDSQKATGEELCKLTLAMVEIDKLLNNSICSVEIKQHSLPSVNSFIKASESLNLKFQSLE